MMVAMGLYDKLIHAITHLKSEFKNSMKLLIPIFIGAGAAIVILSRLFEFLLENSQEMYGLYIDSYMKSKL